MEGEEYYACYDYIDKQLLVSVTPVQGWQCTSGSAAVGKEAAREEEEETLTREPSW